MVAIGISNLGNAIRNRFADSEQGQETAHLEHFPNNITHADQRHFSLQRPQTFAGEKYNAQTRGADVVKITKIKNQARRARSQAFDQSLLKLRGTGAIESPDWTKDQDTFDGLRFEFHVRSRVHSVNMGVDCKGKSCR